MLINVTFLSYIIQVVLCEDFMIHAQRGHQFTLTKPVHATTAEKMVLRVNEESCSSMIFNEKNNTSPNYLTASRRKKTFLEQKNCSSV